VENIRVFYLPNYCPKLNPDDFLNQDIKSHLGKQGLHTKEKMIKTLNIHLKIKQKQPDVIQNFFKGVIINMLYEKCKLLILSVISTLQNFDIPFGEKLPSAK